ncbi:MAG: hypothetical protein MR868_12155 [Lachnospiraceae bacterium]|nr:hypothetical protein [Lachnospiraceae bacterium]
MKRRFLAVTAVAAALSILSSTAAFAQGWSKVGSDWYYYEEDGSVAKNCWITSESGTYWVNVDGRMASNQWVCADDSWYYVDGSGLCLTNQLLTLNNDIYWLGEDGKMAASEWVTTEEGKTYYFQENGLAIKNGWKMIDGYYYYFLKSGVMAVDALVPGGYRVGADGRWIER